MPREVEPAGDAADQEPDASVADSKGSVPLATSVAVKLSMAIPVEFSSVDQMSCSLINRDSGQLVTLTASVDREDGHVLFDSAVARGDWTVYASAVVADSGERLLGFTVNEPTRIEKGHDESQPLVAVPASPTELIFSKNMARNDLTVQIESTFQSILRHGNVETRTVPESSKVTFYGLISGQTYGIPNFFYFVAE